MEIAKLHADNLADVNRANQPYAIIGRLRPTFADGVWQSTEELYPQPSTKQDADEDLEHTAYIDNPDKAAFLAYDGTACIGQIFLRRDWNLYAFVEDLCVAAAYRGRGVGHALLQKAEDWARAAGLPGLALEAQDTNLLACRFYAKCGFSIGAVNTMLYQNFGSTEYAIFWYRRF